MNNQQRSQAELKSIYDRFKKMTIISRKRIAVRLFCFIPAVLLCLFIFAIIFISALLIILLTSIGLLAIPVSIAILMGLLDNVATDLAPPAMLLAGVSCVFIAASMTCLLFIFFPKAVRKFSVLRNWFLVYMNSNKTEEDNEKTLSEP